MNFFDWHYSTGLKIFSRKALFMIGSINHSFSLPLLLLTLFSPWKRLVDDNQVPGFHLDRILQALSFNLISRCIGAISRLVLFFIGILLLVLVFFAAGLGLVVWLVFPPVGLPLFLSRNKFSEEFILRLKTELVSGSKPVSEVLFANPPGAFVLTHLGLTLSDLADLVKNSAVIPDIATETTYRGLVKKFVEAGFLDTDRLISKQLQPQDFIIASSWWDQLLDQKNSVSDKLTYKRPGIGLDLIFGFTPTINQYSVDLSLPQNFSHHLIAREDIVSRMETTFNSGKSLIVYGQPGVGKKTVILEFAHRAYKGELGQKLSYQRVMDFDYNFLLSESLDLNHKKSKLASVFKEAVSAGNVILVIKDIHQLTNSAVEGLDLTDVFEEYLQNGKLRIIAQSSQVDFERFVYPNSRLKKYLEPIEIVPFDKENALKVILNSAADWEQKKYLTFTVPALRQILDGSDRYISDTPFPEKALELLDHVVSWAVQNKQAVITPDAVNLVLSEKTGIPLARLTEREKEVLADLETILHRRLVGQNSAVDLIAKSLRSRVVGIKSHRRPVGTFLFLGPTGVGKTEAAKTLAKIYYGSPENILRFDMAEYAHAEGLAWLIGSTERNIPGNLTSAIRNHPASLLLLDEIEKAPPQVFILFLTMLYEGYITDAFGKRISCEHLFVIATSNAGSEYIRQNVQKGVSARDLQVGTLEFIQSHGIFSPELLNRFDGVVVFEPLAPDQLTQVAKIMLEDLKANLETKGLHLEVTPEACAAIARDGYEPQFGARPMRRLVDIQLGDMLGRAILKGELKTGSRFKIVPSGPPLEYHLEYL